jgi:hypothetical protein
LSPIHKEQFHREIADVELIGSIRVHVVNIHYDGRGVGGNQIGGSDKNGSKINFYGVCGKVIDGYSVNLDIDIIPEIGNLVNGGGEGEGGGGKTDNVCPVGVFVEIGVIDGLLNSGAYVVIGLVIKGHDLIHLFFFFLCISTYSSRYYFFVLLLDDENSSCCWFSK